jgi:hypothetical protein
MTWLASIAVALGGRAPARRFDAAARDPIGAQQQKLLEILQRNRDTEYGRMHGFAAVKSLADYAAAVPVVRYEDIVDGMDRVARGEKNVFTAEDPVMFARTSGTTGRPKLIPVTPTCQGRDHNDQMRTWLYHAQRDHPRLLRGQVVSLVSAAVEGHTEAGIPYGSTTGHIYKNFPAVIRRTYAIPYAVFDIEDYDAKYYAVLRLGLVADVTFLCTANPSSIVKLCEVADENAEALIKDIADGTLRADLDLTEESRRAVEARCRPDRDLARRLERARQRRGGRLLPADYWPSLALVGCWKGGTVGSYVDSFADWFAAEDRPPVPVRDWGYLSSEARCSIPLTDEGAGGVLTVATNVYEFVEAREVDAAPGEWQRWRFLGVGDLEEGRDYHVFLTTTGGLYRYDIDDVIGVEGRYHDAPVIVFRRKGRDVTSLTGEKVSVDQAVRAVAEAGRRAGIRADHYKVEADVKAAQYVFLLEAGKSFPEAKARAFLEAVDEELGELNIEYAAKRKSHRLNPPMLRLMQPGWFERGRRAQFKQGKRPFQWKASVLEQRDPDADGDGDRAAVVAEFALDRAERPR